MGFHFRMQICLLSLNPVTRWHPEVKMERPMVVLWAHLGDLFLKGAKQGAGRAGRTQGQSLPWSTGAFTDTFQWAPGHPGKPTWVFGSQGEKPKHWPVPPILGYAAWFAVHQCFLIWTQQTGAPEHDEVYRSSAGSALSHTGSWIAAINKPENQLSERQRPLLRCPSLEGLI